MGQAEGTLGAQLEERYFRQKVKLGEGSFGTVWRAVDRQSGEAVAIKQLDKGSMPHRCVTRQDIVQEISIMKIFKHQNIIQLFDTFEDNTCIYLALEYCDGGDFGDKIREQGLSIDERELASWMRQMCDAVCVLHTQRICHRDIKPDNFMVHNRTTLKLSDFGLATFVQQGQLLQAICGTRAFNAPEQHLLSQRSAGYHFPVDMWAVGVSMYMVMFGGKHPFLVDDHEQIDELRLLAGKLDFRDRKSAAGFLGLEGVGGIGLRFSEEARKLCKRMVDPDPVRRITASEAVYIPWLKTGGGALKHAVGLASARCALRPWSITPTYTRHRFGSTAPALSTRVSSAPTPSRHG